jgi:predicted permease
MRTLLARALAIFRGRRLDHDLEDEVRFHLEMTAEEFRRRGLNAEEARLAALRQFGGVSQMKEAHRDQRSLPMLETFAQDARYAIRTLRRAPGFTFAALLTLALGIGANTAIFSIVNAVLLRPLPYHEPERLVQLVRRHPGFEGQGQTGRRFMFFRDHLQNVEAIAAWRGTTGFNIATNEGAEFVRAMPVSKEFFDVFAIRPALGTTFTAEHDASGGPDATLLSDALWRRLFGANPAVIGESLLVGDRSFVIIGVMPAWPLTIPPADLYVPLRPSTTGPGGGFNYSVAARLRPGVSRLQADAEAAAAWVALQREFPQTILRNELASGFSPLQSTMSSSVKPALLTILGAVGLLLLIACANAANLLLARASGRGREIAVRAALGAGRGRIIRQLLTESVVLAVAGAGLGVLLAHFAVPGLLALTPPGFTVYQDPRIDGAVLAVTLTAAVVTGILFGLAPAIGLSKYDLVEAFKSDSGRTIGTVRSAWLRTTLVVGEVALCVMLLVGAGLLIQTFVRLRAVDPGFDPQGVLVARMSLQGERYATPEAINRFFDQGLERLQRIPGVRSAAIVNNVPIDRGLNLNVDILDGPTLIEDALTDWRYASTDYFRTIGIPIVAGRGFEDRDRAGASPVAVVNEEFARRFFKGTAALGRHIRIFDTDGAIEIVGIARNVSEQGLRAPGVPVMYVPIAQANPAGVRASHTYFPMCWVVRASDTGPALVRSIRDEIRSLDPRQPFSSFRTMEDVKSASLAEERMQMTLLASFAGIGLLLAAAGIYGLISYSVVQRTREFGIRMALGATGGRLLRSVVWNGAILAIIGAALGLAGAVGAARVLRGFVWGISPLDPATYIIVAVVLIVVAVLASLIPALRAVRLNPVSALRS